MYNPAEPGLMSWRGGFADFAQPSADEANQLSQANK
jgi:hypothetical protein